MKPSPPSATSTCSTKLVTNLKAMNETYGNSSINEYLIESNSGLNQLTDLFKLKLTSF